MVEQRKPERPVLPLSFKFGFKNRINFDQMNWLLNIRNIPELVALKTGKGDATSGQSSPGSRADHTRIDCQEVRILNTEMDAGRLPCTALGKRILAIKINDALKVMKAKVKNLCLRDDGKQSVTCGMSTVFATLYAPIKWIMKNAPLQR